MARPQKWVTMFAQVRAVVATECCPASGAVSTGRIRRERPATGPYKGRRRHEALSDRTSPAGVLGSSTGSFMGTGLLKEVDD